MSKIKSSLSEMEHKNNIVVFSRSKTELYFIRYASIIAGIFICIVLIWGELDSLSMEHVQKFLRVLSVYLPIVLIAEILSRKFIYKIVVDRNSNQIDFHFFKRNKIEKRNISDIQKVCINFYVTFIFSDKHIFFKGNEFPELITFLKTIKPITWGFFSKWTTVQK